MVDAYLIAKLFHSRSVSDISENCIVFVERMADFVDGLSLGNSQFSILPGFRLKEIANLAGRIKEVLTESMCALSCFSVKNGDLFRSGFEIIDQSIDFLHGLLANLRRDELWNECIAVLMKKLCCLLDLLRFHFKLI